MPSRKTNDPIRLLVRLGIVNFGPILMNVRIELVRTELGRADLVEKRIVTHQIEVPKTK